QGSAIAKTAEVLRREKRGGTDGADRPCKLPRAIGMDVLSTHCLRSVFDDCQAVFLRNGINRLHVGALSEKMDRDDPYGLAGDRRFQSFVIEFKGIRSNV